MTYYIVPTPPQTADSILFNSPNGAEGFVKDNQLHLTDGNLHYIYKYDQQMWFMRNDKTGVDYALGVGACPTINVYDIEVSDDVYWQEIAVDTEKWQKYQDELYIN